MQLSINNQHSNLGVFRLQSSAAPTPFRKQSRPVEFTSTNSVKGRLSGPPERSAISPAITPLSDCKYTFANASVIVQKWLRPAHAGLVTEC